MGFLDWRGWDRLDDLDRRFGLRTDPSDRSPRTQRRLKLLGALLLVVAAAIRFATGRWVRAIVALGLAIVFVGVAVNSWIRDRREP